MNTAVDLKLADVERVEVLRGPQGTAFGSAALGGVVRTIPVAPKLNLFEGKVTAGYSNTADSGGDGYNVQAVGNFPLINDKLALRATLYRHEEAGFYRNRAASDPIFQSTIVVPTGTQALAVDQEQVGDRRFTGGRIAALFQPTDDLKFTISYLRQESETDGWGLQTTNAYEHALLQVAPEHAFRGQTSGVFDNDIELANAIMEYDFGWANLLATYSRIESRTNSTQPLTALLPWAVSYYLDNEHDGHIGEIRLNTKFDGAWNLLGGIYAEDLDDFSVGDPMWVGTPESNFFGPGVTGHMGDNVNVRNMKQKAIFGEASWEFLPRTTLTAGVRVYEYDRAELFTSVGVYSGNFYRSQAADASGTSFRGNLSHKFNDNALVYLGWSQGFRIGRPDPGVINPLCDLNGDGVIDGTSLSLESTRTVQSDGVDNYELGGKFTLLGRRLSIAADVFRVDWTDLPVLVNVQTLGARDPCTGGFTGNAGVARSEGVELQANFQVTDAFRVDFGGSYVRATLTKDAPGINAEAGDRLPSSPQLNATLGLQYEFRLGDAAAFVRADPIYVGSFFGDLQQTPVTEAGGYVKGDVSARVAFKHLSLDLFVRNLTNEDAFTNRSSLGGAGGRGLYGYRLRPRTIGLQLSHDF